MPAPTVATGRELVWQKVPGVSRARAIVIDGETWVRLRRVKVLGSLATVEAASGSWTLKRVGWFRTRVSVRMPGSAEDLAEFTPNWLGASGTLAFADGRSYRWACTKSFGREHTLFRADGQAVLRFRGGQRMTLETTDGESDLPLLASICHYLLQLEREDTAVVAAAAGAAAAAG